MSGDILDLIDGALRDVALSDDAMRWTPDPAPAPPRPVDLAGLTYLEIGGVDLTPYVDSVDITPYGNETQEQSALANYLDSLPRAEWVVQRAWFDGGTYAIASDLYDEALGIPPVGVREAYGDEPWVGGPQLGEFLAAVDVELTPWQQRIVDRLPNKPVGPFKIEFRYRSRRNGFVDVEVDYTGPRRLLDAIRKRERMRYLHMAYSRRRR